MTAGDDVDAFSAATLKAGSASFAAAARLFDADIRRDAQHLYAWCRHCDDVIDGQVLGHGRLQTAEEPRERLARLQDLTRSALRGRTVSDPAFVAFQRVALKRNLPERYPFDLLEGFRMDVEGHRYRDLNDTLTYCYHVAGVVGLMMAVVMGVPPDDGETLDRACDLGLAFQLTNIARDVVEDAERGRVYLPECWLEDAHVPPHRVADPEFRARIHGVAVQLVALADEYYASAGIGMARLPLRAAMAIGAARSVYRGIGARLRALGPAAWDARIVIPQARKLALVGSGGALGVFSTMRTGSGARRQGLWTRPGREGSTVTP